MRSKVSHKYFGASFVSYSEMASKFGLLLLCSLLMVGTPDLTVMATPPTPKTYYKPFPPYIPKSHIAAPTKSYTPPTTTLSPPSVKPYLPPSRSLAPPVIKPYFPAPKSPVSPVVKPPLTPYPPKGPTPPIVVKPPMTPYPPKDPTPPIVVNPPMTPYPPKVPSPSVGLKPPVAPYPPIGLKPPVAPYPPQSPAPLNPTPFYGSLPPVKKEECEPLCGKRCGKHSRLAVCMRACSTCCIRCKCVPPGTYGNQKLCGRCYTDMTTHGGRLKCP